MVGKGAGQSGQIGSPGPTELGRSRGDLRLLNSKKSFPKCVLVKSWSGLVNFMLLGEPIKVNRLEPAVRLSVVA